MNRTGEENISFQILTHPVTRFRAQFRKAQNSLMSAAPPSVPEGCCPEPLIFPWTKTRQRSNGWILIGHYCSIAAAASVVSWHARNRLKWVTATAGILACTALLNAAPKSHSFPVATIQHRSLFEMIFRQLFDNASSTYTYLLADERSREATIIDSVFEQSGRGLALIRELDLKLLYAIDTHCHADHVTGVWLMKQKTGCRIGAANVDVELEHHDVISFGRHSLEVRATPGHTNGCLTYVTEDQARAFTGDALLIRGCGRADFQQGNADTLYDSISEQILSLPDSCLIYPGHDYHGRTVSSVAEGKAFNARIGSGANKGDFVG